MTDWSAPEVKPAPTGMRTTPKPATLPKLSSHFGYRSDPIRGVGRMHYGLDIPGPLGTPVLASSGGLVAFAGPAGSYGQMVELDHGGGLRTRYAHLSRLLVRVGETVGQRQAIALMGSTGRSTGSHLHFEVRRHGRATDPTPLLVPSSPLSSMRLATVDTGPHISDFARRRASARSGEIKGARQW
ncbi:M23 family metallopeptidase [Sphingopyxis sp. JAI128]|uniref:M23 family metallopeptidase n=1 Tax=Sphingopyxis sp. JAI128 TaxID=2723066 RepID=UPI0016162075|nr:M23 family metallopeptidase [Sphingopyxis sp. JAI128]MBB6427271.1 murein DD-endopeptidase MepM/ murein hydrolase activator NlpD [Sphingopyxis sp. JAI128]